tara:strand:+ start:346 stop:1152 length:807 start_codon:yes stop_codon:yes gene_type:complete
MPNHCYCVISVDTQKDKEILKKIEKLERGLAEFIMPMPQCLNNTTSESNIISQEEYDEQELRRKNNPKETIFQQGITREMHEEFLDKFKFDNWYSWALHNWGTKWGCYDNELDADESTYRFTTAWSPLDEDIIEEFAKIVPNFYYSFEEETGWGGIREYENGVCISHRNYDEPMWDHEKTFIINDKGVIKEGDGVWNQDTRTMEYEEGFKYLCSVSELLEDHDNGSGYFEKGWYESYCLGEYYGKTLKDVLEWHTHKDRKDNQPIIFG